MRCHYDAAHISIHMLKQQLFFYCVGLQKRRKRRDINWLTCHLDGVPGLGWGPRSCIGTRLALTEAKMALIAIIKEYKFVEAPDTEKVQYC